MKYYIQKEGGAYLGPLSPVQILEKVDSHEIDGAYLATAAVGQTRSSLQRNSEWIRVEDLLPTAPEEDMEHDSATTDMLPSVDSMKEKYDRFLEVVDVSNTRHFFRPDEITTVLREGIIDGSYQKNCPVVIHAKNEQGAWKRSDSTMAEFAKAHFSLRVLYQPIWSHAMAGLKWGAIVGVFLKLADTFFMLAAVDAGMALLFAIAVGVCVIPRIGWMGVAVVAFAMTKFSGANFFMMGLSAGLVGALLGCLPGMAIGGIMGFSRKHSLALAKDASPEPAGLFVKAVLLPLIAGCTLFAFYIFVVNPWLVSALD